MAHDAATGMLEPNHIAVYKYAQTQRGNLPEQLNCGARALDLRLILIKGKLEFHHGGVRIDYAFERGMNDLKEWLKEHPQELVVLNWACHGGYSCWEALKDELSSLNLPALVEACDTLNDLTIHDARGMASVEEGGFLLSMKSCPEENYDPTIECWGLGHNKIYGCIDEKKNDYPFAQFWNYIDTTVASHGDNPWMIQAHWQTSLESAALGELFKSSLINDEKKSGINSRFTEAIQGGRVKGSVLNFVEVDYVCDGGLELFQVLDGYNQQKILRSQNVEDGSSFVATKEKKLTHRRLVF